MNTVASDYNAINRMITLRSQSGASYVALEELERELEQSSSVYLKIEVVDGPFSAGVSVWFEIDQLVRFTALVAQLRRSEPAAARLDSMSPGEFELLLTSDLVGHVVVTYSIRLNGFAETPERGMYGGFELDSEYVNDVAGRLAKLCDQLG